MEDFDKVMNINVRYKIDNLRATKILFLWSSHSHIKRVNTQICVSADHAGRTPSHTESRQHCQRVEHVWPESG